MLTIFSVAEPFEGRIRISRENAINSWRRLGPACEVILFGGGEELASIAPAWGITHVPDVARSEWGTPLLDDVFGTARRLARGRTLMFSNCDMLYFGDLFDAIAAVPFQRFMMCGRRWDVDLDEHLELGDDAAWMRVESLHGRTGKWHGPTGLDFFIFPRALEFEMKSFVVGRPRWDNWLLWKIRSTAVPLIDATGSLKAIHQNHDYRHLRHGPAQYRGPEMTQNAVQAGGLENLMGLREADWVLKDGKVRRPPLHRWLLAASATTRLYQHLLGVKRTLTEKARGR